MTEQPAFESATTTLPPQSANGTSPQRPTAARPLKSGWVRTVAQLRRIMRRDRHGPQVR
jgi:hypothetical protein